MPLDRHVIVFLIIRHGFHEGTQRRAPLSLRVLVPSTPVEQTIFENLFLSVHVPLPIHHDRRHSTNVERFSLH